ncbi:hypothetical protein AGMMS49992_31780 [Clostridia bacterium]|nr:hypothetical protein AGMMS49992_31780 [Clostridia bacterium]
MYSSTSATVNIYEGPGYDYKLVIWESGKLSVGTKIIYTSTDFDKKWVYIEWNDKYGWIPIENLIIVD